MRQVANEVDQLRSRIAGLEGELERLAAFRAVIDGMFEGIQILDPEWRYVYLNETAARHGRRRPAELLGKRIVDEFPGIEQTEVFRLMRCCMQDRVPQQMLNHFTYPDGRSAWFDLRMSPVPAGILVLSVDVSAQKEMEEQVRASRELLQLTLECMAEGVVVTNTQARVTLMNPAAEVLTGWSATDATDRPLDELARFYSHHTGQPVEHVVDTILREGLKLGLANHTLLEARGGVRIPIASSGAPIRDAAGQMRGVVMVLKSMKDEYELNDRFLQAQKMEAIGRLASGVAHDFNNILTVIRGYSGIALESLPTTEPFWRFFDEIDSASARAAALTRQLLAFSRKQAFEPRPAVLNTVIEGMEKLLRPLVGELVSIQKALEPRLGTSHVDPTHIEQAVMNLAVNARDAMPRGGRLTIGTANLDADASQTEVPPGSYVVLSVTDTGCGMTPETIAHIFEPFFTTKAPGKGTGLGLATVHGIVEQAGGHIRVQSEPDRGTTFRLYFPRSTTAAPPVTRALVRPAVTGGRETILIAEDNPAVLRLAETALREKGYTVLSATNEEEAVRAAAAPGPIHLLLSDAMLPGTSGHAIATRVAAGRPGIRILYMSGHTTDEAALLGVSQATVPFLQKPFAAADLLRKVREVLSAGTE